MKVLSGITTTPPRPQLAATDTAGPAMIYALPAMIYALFEATSVFVE
jgi:hypothetical protein